MPFEGKQLPALLHLPASVTSDATGTKLPCVIQISGMDGWKEMSVAMDGDRYLARGVAVLVVDRPGHSESLIRKIWYDPDTYGKVGAASFDYLSTRQEIDLARVGSEWSEFRILLVHSSGRGRTVVCRVRHRHDLL